MTDRIHLQRNMPGDGTVDERETYPKDSHNSIIRQDFQLHSSRPTRPQRSIAESQGDYRKDDRDKSYDSASYGESSRFSANFEAPNRYLETEQKTRMTPGEYIRSRAPILLTTSDSTSRGQRLLTREEKVDLAHNQQDAGNLSAMLAKMNDLNERPAPEDWTSARKIVDQIANAMDVLSDTWDAEERARYQPREILDESLDRDASHHARLQESSGVQRGHVTSFRDPGSDRSRMQDSSHTVPFRRPMSSATSRSTTMPDADVTLPSVAAVDFQRGLQKRNEAYDRARDSQLYPLGSQKGMRTLPQDSSLDQSFSVYNRAASSFPSPRRFSFDSSISVAASPYKNYRLDETRRTSTRTSGTTVRSGSSSFGPDPKRAGGRIGDASRTETSTLSDPNRERKYRKRSRAPNPESCSSCGLQESPEWRRGPDGMRTLCNACGLYFAKLLRRKRAEASPSVAAHATGLPTEEANPEASITIEELRESLRIPS